jgi:hypothetical protein
MDDIDAPDVYIYAPGKLIVPIENIMDELMESETDE